MAGVPTYTPQPGDRLFPGAQGVTEQFGAVWAWCGQAAVTAVLAAKGIVTGSAATVAQLSQQTISAGEALGRGGLGGTTPDQLTWLAGQHGVTLQGQPWQQAIANASNLPVVLGLNKGSAVDPWDPSLNGHYITVFGQTAAGNYIVSDPNSPQANAGQLVTETPGQIAAADPFAALVPTNIAPASTATLGSPIPGVDAINGLVSTVEAGFKEFVIRGSIITVGVLLVLIGLATLLFDRENVETAGRIAASAA